MTNKSKARHGIRGSYRFKLNPTTRAIRNAFALGLAMAASAPAMAGTCPVTLTPPADASVDCNGFFNSSQYFLAFGIDDLTVVFGGTFPTVVIGNVGFDAINIYSDTGNITLHTDADVFANGGNGITVYAPNGDVDVTNTGSVSALYGNGIVALSYQGNVDVTNAGQVLAVSNVVGASVTGISADTKYGNADVTTTEGSSVSAVSLYGAKAVATGIYAHSKYGNASITNYGSVEASTIDGSAYGIVADSKYGNASVTVGDTGSVQAETSGDGGSINGYNGGIAIGALAHSEYGDATATNNGSISATASGKYGTAIGMGASAYNGVATANNYGDISASTTGKYGTAAGAYAIGDNASITNGGSISASAKYYGTDYAGHVRAYGAFVAGTQANLTNLAGGSISAIAVVYDGTALAIGSYVNATIDAGTYNHGDISATAIVENYGTSTTYLIGNSGDATAIGSITGSQNNGGGEGLLVGYGIATLENYSDGSISAFASTKYGNASATGSLVSGFYAFTNNAGSIYAHAEAGIGNAIAIGNETVGAYSRFYNSGDITAEASTVWGNAAAVGVVEYGLGYAHATNYGEGAISATAANYYIGNATAYGAKVIAGDDASLSNSQYASISASASTQYGDARAFGAVVSSNGDAYTYNSGNISATATVGYTVTDPDTLYTYHYGIGNATAIGSLTAGYTSGYLNNPGDISATALNYGEGNAFAVGAIVSGFYATTSNSGNSITAYAYAFLGNAVAIGSQTSGFSAELINSGDISADAVAIFVGNATAYGNIVQGDKYANTFNEYYGSISASAYSFVGDATATGSLTAGYFAHTGNSGSISADAYATIGDAYAYGASTTGTYADLNNTDTGSISADASAYSGVAFAIGSLTQGYDATTDNAGSISADASVIHGYAVAYGAANIADRFSTLTNFEYGDISATAYAFDGYAKAVGTYVYGTSSLTTNDGTISASATEVVAGDYNGAVAIGNQTTAYGFAVTVNNGDISATATTYDSGNSTAVGSVTAGYYGKYVATTANYGSISATATTGDYGLARAFGAESLGKYAAQYNSGSISAVATAGYGGEAHATGSYVGGKYDSLDMNYAGGSISAHATADYGTAIAYGAIDYSLLGNARMYNSGDIGATADAYHGAAKAVGVFSHGYYYSVISNDAGASISAVANADYGVAYATGSEQSAKYGSLLYNDGAISAVANAYAGGAQAIGSLVYGTYYFADTFNTGTISAVANADYGVAYAYGSITTSAYGVANLFNSGDITADATAYGDGGGAQAVGAVVAGYLYGYVSNTGNITATASGYGAVAVGLSIYGGYGTYVYNDGAITATATGTDSAAAIAVAMRSYGVNELRNYGTITANGNGARIAVYSNDEGVAALYNYGTITGSIQTGKYSDYLLNDTGATWNALQASYFGYGDDEIINNGTINMPGSLIDLGGYGEYGNSFYNNGTINVNGHATIDMGHNAVLIASNNPNPFWNDGILNFLDGAQNDTLTIIGDFAGHGDLIVDLNATNKTSDLLYIEGDIIEPTVQTISGVLHAPPTVAFTEIPVVYVSGTSKDGDFIAGTIATPTDLFYTLSFGVISHINVANTSDDVFALGVTVSGLSARGALANSISPAVQNLWHDGLGNVFQREGTSRDENEYGAALWIRTFGTTGEYQPTAQNRNFGSGGQTNFRAHNFGTDVGLAFNISQEFSIGLTAGESTADVNMKGSNGRADIKAEDYGIYGIWTPGNGFYLDLTYRHMTFDVKGQVTGGGFTTSGDANGYSMEAGYAFDTASGWKVEPQFQYSRMKVDNVDTLGSTWGSFAFLNGDSARARLGVSLRKTYSKNDDHSWTPYVAYSAVHESEGANSYSIAGNFFGDNSQKGTHGLLEAGLTGQMGAWTLFGGINWQDRSGFNSVLGGQVGLRYAFGQAPAKPMAPPPAPMPEPQKTCADLDDDGDGVNNCNDKCPDSVAGQAIGPDGCPVPLTIDLKGVNFDFDKSTLRPDAVAILDEAVAILGKYPELKVEVAGHTDSVGSEQYNQGLSERRAKAVYAYLTGHGIDASRLAGPDGFGESKPIDTNDTKEGRARNRRTELNVQN